MNKDVPPDAADRAVAIFAWQGEGRPHISLTRGAAHEPQQSALTGHVRLGPFGILVVVAEKDRGPAPLPRERSGTTRVSGISRRESFLSRIILFGRPAEHG
jgi:hypothetical protein